MVALSLLGGALGAGAYSARHLPVCSGETPIVAVQDATPCVSAEFSTQADGVLRATRGVFHQGQAVEDLSSATSRVLHPSNPRPTRDVDGQLEVVSWNLHHSSSPGSQGARPQLSLMTEELNSRAPDVALLQEVNPWDARDLVEETGMTGYYSQTTPRQGNMILLGPELEVSGNQRVTLNHDIAVGDRAAAREVVNALKGEEPRAAQAVRVQAPGMEGEVTVFNTHLSTGSASAEARASEGDALQSFVAQVSGGGTVVGGGDFNARTNQRVVPQFRADGYQVEGATIDWLVSGGVESKVESATLWTPAGVQISDHPIVSGQFR